MGRAASEKWLVSTGEATFAMRWRPGVGRKGGESPNGGRMSVGGYCRVMGTMETFIEDYLQQPVPPARYPQQNRARYDFPCPREDVRRAIAEATDHGITVEAVRAVGRVW
jgi:hypothetical protein